MIVRSLTTAWAAIALLGLSSSRSESAPTVRWKLPISPGSEALLRVDSRRGRLLVVDGRRARLLDRAGAVLIDQALPRALGERIDVAELGPRGMVIAGARGALLLSESGPARVVSLPDGKPVGAAPMLDGGVRICFASDDGGGVAAIDLEGHRRWTARVQGDVSRCAPSGISPDGSLWASGKRTVVSVSVEGRIRARIEVPTDIERAPIAWPTGALVQTEGGLLGVNDGGIVFTVPEVDDGAGVEGPLGIGHSGRRLVWIDSQGAVRRSSTPLEPPLRNAEAHYPLEEQPPQLVVGIVAAPARDALVLLGTDGKERFRLALPGAQLALLAGAGLLIVARSGGVEALELPAGVLEDPVVAMREVIGDPALDAWAKVAARARMGASAVEAVTEVGRLMDQLVAIYPMHHAALLETLDELGPIVAPGALVLLEHPLHKGDGVLLARLIAKGGPSLRAPIIERLHRAEPPLVAAHVLALLSTPGHPSESEQNELLKVLTAPGPGGCPGEPEESATWAAVVEVLAGLTPTHLDTVSRALGGLPLPACRARALKDVWARNSPPAVVLARFRDDVIGQGRVDAGELQRVETLGAPAASVLSTLLDTKTLNAAAVQPIVAALGRMKEQPLARATLLEITAGGRRVPVGARAVAVRAMAEDQGAGVGAAIAAGLREVDVPPSLLRDLLSAAARRTSAGERALVADALGAALGRTTDEGTIYEIFLALVEIAPDRAGATALTLASDSARAATLRVQALRVVARCPRSGMRPTLEHLAEGGGPIAEVATRTLLPYLGLRLDEQQRIVQVDARSAASRAGLRSGDVLVAIDGKRFETLLAYEEYLSTLRVGEPIAVKVLRGGSPFAVQFHVGSALEIDAD